MYEVSTAGRVRSWACNSGGRLNEPRQKATWARKGYIFCRMSINRKVSNVLVHIAVARTFICERLPGLQCDHINGIKTDNRPENLRWVTPSVNVREAFRIGLKSGDVSAMALATRKIRDEDLHLVFEMRSSGVPIGEICSRFGVGPGCIYGILGGRRRTAYLQRQSWFSARAS